MGTRHVRQVILPEIGEAGQARLASATAVVAASGVAGEIEARYLAGAGVGHVVVADEAIAAAANEVDPGVRVEVGGFDVSRIAHDWPPFDARDASAREVALGAWRALRAMRAVVRGEGA
jgi:hypothetical protein